jgi:hypothetical protein
MNIFSERIGTKIKEKCKFAKASVKSLSVIFNDCFAYLNKLDTMRKENLGLVENGLSEFTKELRESSKKKSNKKN